MEWGRPKFYYWDRYTGRVEPCGLEAWGNQMGDIGSREVAKLRIPSPWNADDEILVSTVFLGIDYNFAAVYDPNADQRPILWETMIFGLPEEHDLYEQTWRYPSLEEAKDGHVHAVKLVRRSLATTQNGVTSAFDFFINPDWDELARLVMNKIAGTEVSRFSWKHADASMDAAKDTYGEVAKLIVAEYERSLIRKNRVVVRRDDLAQLANLLGPMRGALVTRIRTLLERKERDG